ncbi:MAG: hypothetical protein J6T88_02200 [Bacteroidales bacterium]|nr:hypothetical protein [Bacteroidales bacterium]
MKRKLLLLAIIAIVTAGSVYAQFRTYWDPFANGDKYLGISYSNGGFILPNAVNVNTNKYVLNDFSRSFFNPGVAIHYRRVNEHRNISTANTFILSFNHWSGKVEGAQASNTDSTWTTKYSINGIFLTDLYSLLIPIGDNLNIDLGLGVTIGSFRTPKYTNTYFDGTSESGNGSVEGMSAYLNLALGVDYRLTDNMLATCSFTTHAFNVFGMIASDEPGFFTARSGVSVSYRMPYQLMLGILFQL